MGATPLWVGALGVLHGGWSHVHPTFMMGWVGEGEEASGEVAAGGGHLSTSWVGAIRVVHGNGLPLDRAFRVVHGGLSELCESA